jgi:hypothetical protein
MSFAYLAQRPFFACSLVGGWWIRSELMCGPRIARKAGRRVSAAETATTTEIAAMRPIVVTSGMPATASETSAIVTVPPAKNTAPPEVATEREMDSFMGNPSCRPRMWRVTMNNA